MMFSCLLFCYIPLHSVKKEKTYDFTHLFSRSSRMTSRQKQTAKILNITERRAGLSELEISSLPRGIKDFANFIPIGKWRYST